MCAHLRRSIQDTEELETALLKKTREINSLSSIALFPLKGSAVKGILKSPIKTEVMKTTHRFHHSLSPSKNLFSYLKNGVCAGIFAGFTAYKASLTTSKKYLNAGTSLSLGSADLSMDAKVVPMLNGKFDPHLELRAEAQAALAEVKAFGSIGNTFIHADAEGKVGVGVATGEAKAVINKEEISLKAEGSVAALRGEVKGSFTIFGITIEATGSGEVGALGGGVEFSSKSGEFTIGGKASLVAGLGFKIKVKYN
ncbi:hypothetical protein Aargi30884_02060 [Amedibacterium intestinale]|uniref:Uncharacterized protein n=1 Tax=Amedibacterium intestinale TaxID=2583452 RepID=A0A6N4TEX5_9FIRM|nr:hypothetical protein Aargi30884_02060 [Amedibacterium intestinale]